MIDYAGGTTPRAALTTTRIERYADGVLRVIDVDPSEFETYDMRNGDKVEIPEVTDPIEDFVSVSGEVLVDGRFGFRQNMTVRGLLERAQLKPTARLDLAFVQRRNDDGTLRLDRISILPGSADLLSELRRGDKVNVLAASRFVDQAEVTIRGAVRDSSLTLPYPQDGKLTLEEAVLLAGGLEENATNEILVLRTPQNNREERTYMRVTQDSAVTFVLEPFDEVVVYANERFADIAEVSISGAVRNPVRIRYDTSLSLRDLLYLAGGASFEAARDRVEIYRLSLLGDETRTLVATTSIDAIERDEQGGVDLLPYDEIVVRSSAEFTEIEFVEVRGEVRYPGRYARIPGENQVSDLVRRAGGLTDDAFPAGATLFREGDDVGYVVLELDDILGDTKAPENMVLLNGDVLNVPKKVGLITIYTAGTNAARFGVDSTNQDGTIQVAYQGDRDAAWYIENFAGGFNEETARRSETTVMTAAGGIRETRGALGIRDYPQVEPGGTIRAGIKPPKPPTVQRERSSWGEIAQATLAGVTSLVTLLVIIDRL